MSSSIWTQCAAASEQRPLRLEPWRAVEAQHQVSTRKLVDSDAEQLILEQLIDAAKPVDSTRGRLHYLLATPFRYPPLRHGSRFGTRREPGMWYGAELQRTVFAEVAYYRLLFLEGTMADLGLIETGLTLFSARLVTDRGLDLTAPPYDVHTPALSSPSSYEASHVAGAAMRVAAVEAFRYRSARDPEGGAAVAAFTPAVFGRRSPRRLESWYCSATRTGVEFARRDYFHRSTHIFSRDVFLIAGALPSPSP